MRLKTAPRVVIGLALCAGIGYGINFYLESRPKPTPVPTIDQSASQPATVGVVQTDVLPPVQPAKAPVAEAQPAPQPVQVAPRTQSDAALNALLKGGTK